MNRLALLLILASVSAFGAEHGSEGGKSTTTWKWVNFGILAAGLGLLIARTAGPYFKSRNEQIRRELDEARSTQARCEAQVAEIESKLKNLDGEIASFKRESLDLVAREGERLRSETAAMVAKIESRTADEIQSLSNAARAELKAEVARLALGIAEKRLAAGLPPGAQASLVKNFIVDLEKAAA
ncbi:MAG: ATP synthase F0 subunit B [Bryobacteraceae bacterium]|nr:ATP synthase F0 subunit B [Bryobacteraceae bacterium]